MAKKKKKAKSAPETKSETVETVVSGPPFTVVPSQEQRLSKLEERFELLLKAISRMNYSSIAEAVKKI